MHPILRGISVAKQNLIDSLRCRLVLGLKGLIVPEENAPEAAVVSGVQVIGVRSLPDIVAFLRHEKSLLPHTADITTNMQEFSSYEEDFSEVKGQEHAKRALES
ncbi:MAG: hypothetical protein HZA14_02555 [Nitrospirae bacterium]|nr:hypothetical protein [Nitrospirota bacterium]